MLLEYFYLQSIANNVCSYRHPNSPQVFKLSHELVTKVCLFVTFSCLRSQTLYKEKLLQYLDIVGVVHLLSISVQRFCDPPGARTQDPNIKSVVLYLLS